MSRSVIVKDASHVRRLLPLPFIFKRRVRGRIFPQAAQLVSEKDVAVEKRHTNLFFVIQPSESTISTYLDLLINTVFNLVLRLV